MCGKGGRQWCCPVRLLVAGGLGATWGGRRTLFWLLLRRRVMPLVLFHFVTAMPNHPKARRLIVSSCIVPEALFWGLRISPSIPSLHSSSPSPSLLYLTPPLPPRSHITQLLLPAMTSTRTLLLSHHQEFSQRAGEGGRQGRRTSHRPSQSWNRT